MGEGLHLHLSGDGAASTAQTQASDKATTSPRQSTQKEPSSKKSVEKKIYSKIRETIFGHDRVL
jgi:hypothetical protein